MQQQHAQNIMLLPPATTISWELFCHCLNGSPAVAAEVINLLIATVNYDGGNLDELRILNPALEAVAAGQPLNPDELVEIGYIFQTYHPTNAEMN